MQSSPRPRFTEVSLSKISGTLQVLFLYNNNSLVVDSDVFLVSDTWG